MEIEFDEVFEEFIVEAKEYLSDIESELLQIEEQARAEELDQDLINRVFRAIHSIKGAAGFLGLTTIGDLSHSLESVLDKIRSAELDPVENVVEVLLKSADRLGQLIDAVMTSNEEDVSELVTKLDQVLLGATSEETSEPVAEAPEVEAAPDAEEAAASPASDTAAEQVEDAAADAADAPQATVAPTVTPEAEPAPASAPSEAVAKASSQSEAPRPDASIRVSVQVLDGLMNLAGELVLGRNQLLQALSTGSTSALQYVGAHLDQVTSDLQEAVMQTRMQPIGNAFSKFPRIVRDLSRQLGKKCRLVVEGSEVELDKSLIEAVGAPLTHLIRNSVDHGVEMPDERAAVGKNREGTVLLKAFHQGGKVHVMISDDGAGINATVLRNKAVAKGLMSQAQADQLSEREAFELIFAPGFSTAEQVTDVSGRGVGMDVVRSNLESIGGSVQLDSTIGKGTTIVVHIPLTLAILAAIVVSCGERRYAIPQANIREIVRIRAAEGDDRIQSIRGTEVLRLRGKLLPVVRLQGLVDGSSDDSHEGSPEQDGLTRNIVVVDAGSSHFGLLVESQLDAEEIVAKPLGRHFNKCSEVAGATILGDGRVAMILDVAGIATMIQSRSGDLEVDEAAAEEESGLVTESLVLFENGEDHFAIPLGAVLRIELISQDEFGVVGRHLTYTRRGKVTAAVQVDQFITAHKGDDLPKHWGLVVESHDRELSILAGQLQDIREVAIDLDLESFVEPGVHGSFQIGDLTYRLLDAGFFVDQVFPPKTKTVHGPAESESSVPKRILLAEDTLTFRRVITNFLSEAGFDVVACEDGQEAWERLNGLGFEVDAIVSDIEMPRVNGYELARMVRDDERSRDLPLMALSSLASDSDVKKGLEAGFDAYEAKLDRTSMVETLQSVMNRAKV